MVRRSGHPHAYISHTTISTLWKGLRGLHFLSLATNALNLHTAIIYFSLIPSLGLTHNVSVSPSRLAPAFASHLPLLIIHRPPRPLNHRDGAFVQKAWTTKTSGSHIDAAPLTIITHFSLASPAPIFVYTSWSIQWSRTRYLLSTTPTPPLPPPPTPTTTLGSWNYYRHALF